MFYSCMRVLQGVLCDRYVNHSFGLREKGEVVKLGFASLEERVETVLREFGITCVNKTVGGKDNGGEYI